MAQTAAYLDRENFVCAICLDLLNDPTTIPCGHSFCICCVKTHFDGEGEQRPHRCPHCRQTFTARPALVKNTMLVALVDNIRMIDFQTDPLDVCNAGPDDVVCDACTDRKRKALKSCLVCRKSYCKEHLQIYHTAPSLRNHRLVDPSKTLLENSFSNHDDVMKKFFHTDLQYSIEDREQDVELLRQEMEAINRSADKSVKDSDKIFAELICLMGKLRSDVKKKVRTRQKAEVNRVKELQEELEQELAEVNSGFVENNNSLPPLSDSKDWRSSLQIHPRRYFEEVPAAVLEVRDRIQDVLRDA